MFVKRSALRMYIVLLLLAGVLGSGLPSSAAAEDRNEPALAGPFSTGAEDTSPTGVEPASAPPDGLLDALALAGDGADGRPILDDSRELVSLRDQYTKVWENPDGSRVTEVSTVPLHWREGRAWVDIDSTLEEVEPGVFRSRSNSWSVEFASTSEGVELRMGDEPVTLVPVGAADVAPRLGEDGSSVLYPSVWPGVDVRYTVTPVGVKEDVILRRAPDKARLDFLTVGTRLRLDADGLLRAAEDGLGLGRAESFDAKGRSVDHVAEVVARTPLLSPLPTVSINLDRTALSRMSADSWPVVVDPTYYPTALESTIVTEYKNTSGSAVRFGDPSGWIRLGNSAPSSGPQYWRSTFKFDVSQGANQYVNGAHLQLHTLKAGNPALKNVRVTKPTGTSWAGGQMWGAVYPGNGDGASPASKPSDTWAPSQDTSVNPPPDGHYFNVTSYVRSVMDGGSSTVTFGIKGEEPTSNVWTYKAFDSATMYLYTNTSAVVAPEVLSPPNNTTQSSTTFNVKLRNKDSRPSGLAVGVWPQSGGYIGVWCGGSQNHLIAPNQTCTIPVTVPSAGTYSWAGIAWEPHMGAANFSAGLSPWTSTRTLTVTPTSPLPGSPTGLTADPGNQQTLVGWSPAPTNGGPAVDTYWVGAFHPTNSNLNVATTVAGTARESVLTGLVNGVQYSVVVRAHSPNGWSSTWATGSVTPSATAAPYPVRYQTATAGNGAAMVSWQSPRANGSTTATHYVIQLWRNGQWVTQTGLLPATGLHNRYLWTGLTNGWTYTFKVFPYGTNYGTGKDTNAVTPTTNPTPYQPRNPSAVGLLGTAVVSWQAPEAGPQPNKYLVQIFETDGTYVGQEETISGAVTALQFLDLDHSATYVAAVYSHGTAGYSKLVASNEFTAGSGTLLTPTNVVATRGDQQATVTWTSPSIAVGVSSYTVQAYAAADDTPLGSVTSATSTATVTGLRNGTAVYFKVSATYVLISGPPSADSNTVVPAGPPFAPEHVTATRGDTEITVTWSPPSERADGTPGDNGDPITGYEILTHRADNDALVSITPATNGLATVGGLQNGTGYYAVVRAINTIAAGDNSDPSNTVTPAGEPFAPVNVVATATDGQAHVSWDPPPQRPDGTPGDNGAPITSYTVTASPGGQSTTTDALSMSADVFDLANGTTYVFTVVASNDLGQSAPSEPSNPVTPAGPPGVPTGLGVVLADQSALITWNPSDSNGADVTYNVVLQPGGTIRTVPGTQASFGGLAHGATYTASVTAVNAAGSSAPTSVTFTVLPDDAGPTDVVADATDGSATISWNPPSGSTGAVTYRLTASPGGAEATTTGTSVTFEGLTNGITYRFVVVAENQAGSFPPVTSNSVTPRFLLAHENLDPPPGTEIVHFEIPVWEGHGVTRLQLFIDDRPSGEVCFVFDTEETCGRGDDRGFAQDDDAADYNLSSRVRVLLDHENGIGTAVSYPTINSDGSLEPALPVDFYLNPGTTLPPDYPSVFRQYTTGEGIDGNIVFDYRFLNSHTPSQLGGVSPAINGLVRVMQGPNGTVEMDGLFAQYPSYEIMRDRNGTTNVIYQRQQEAGGPSNLYEPSTDFVAAG